MSGQSNISGQYFITNIIYHFVIFYYFSYPQLKIKFSLAYSLNAMPNLSVQYTLIKQNTIQFNIMPCTGSLIITMMNKQKQKNDLVFKLLKSMNPFFTELNQRDQLRKRINEVIEKSKAIPHSGEQSDSSLQTISEEQAMKEIVKVLDIQINGGTFLQIKKKVRFVQEDSEERKRELKNRKIAELVREQIFDVQAQTYKTFKIQGEYETRKNKARSSTSFNPQYQSQTYQNKTQSLLRNKNQRESKAHQLLSMPTARSLSLSQLTYRHETDQKKRSLQLISPEEDITQSKYISNSKVNENSSYNSNKGASLLLLSKSNNSIYKNTNASMKTKNQVNRKLFPSQITCTGSLSKNLSLIKRKNPEKTNQIKSCGSSVTPKRHHGSEPRMMKQCKSEKVLKQSHKLDMEIFASQLNRKMLKSEKKCQWLS